MPTTYRAAWVPDNDPNRPWDDAAALAVEWIELEAADQGQEAVLVTNTMDSQPLNSPLGQYMQHGKHFSPRSRPNFRGVPVLAYVPVAKTLELAISVARGSSLCVVETDTYPVRGWAAVVGAVDLLTGDRNELDSRLAEPLDRLEFYGNNAYGPPFDRQRARSVLNGLQGAGLLDRDLIISALAAHGISETGQQR